MPGTLPLGRPIRLAIVTALGDNFVECSFYDKFGEKSFRCPKPHPYAGRGGGVLVGIERDAMVVVAGASNERWIIVAVVPNTDYYDLSGFVSGARVGETI
jgi:hypothetical protein